MNRPSFSETLRKLVCAVVMLAPAASPAAEGQSLTQMTEQSAAEWLVGSEWQGTVAGQATEIWIPSPGILVWRGEVMPGIWDCRAAALTRQGKGEAGWRWNKDLPSAGSFKLAESLRELTITDQAIGQGKLTPKARHVLQTTTGEAGTKAKPGLETWLKGKELTHREHTIKFGADGMASYGEAKGRWRVTAPGVAEAVMDDKGWPRPLLVQFAPNLRTARFWTDWGTGTARTSVDTPGEPAVMEPAFQALFNAPDPGFNNLVTMKANDFNQWIIGTEWEIDHGKKNPNAITEWNWFQTELTMQCRNSSSSVSFGYIRGGTGSLTWNNGPGLNEPNAVVIDASLASASQTSNKGSARLHLIGRRLPWTMGAPSASELPDWLLGVTVDLGEVKVTIPEPDVLAYSGNGGRRFPLKILGPGFFGAVWGGTDTMFFSIKSGNSGRLYWRHGCKDISYTRNTKAVASTPPKPVNLGGTAPIALKASQASVSALLVSELGGGQMAGQASRLSLTALPQGDEEPASLSFNQAVGPQMQKALREVQRFQAVRQKGWPRGQNMELSFADKFSGKDGPSAAVACALVLEGVLAGRKLDPAFAVTGDMNADGSVQPIGGVAAKLRGATKARCTCIGIPQGNAIGALDLAIIDGAAPFLSMQVFSMETFEDALALGAMDGAARPVLLEFTTATGPLKQNPASLRQPAVLASLRDIVKRQPNHLSATILLMIAEGRLPQRLSPAGSLNAVDVAVQDIVKSTMHDLTTASVLDKNAISKARVALRQIKDKLDPRTVPVASAWIAWSEAADRLSGLTVKQESAVRKALEDINATARAARDAGTKLMQNAEFNEDLKR